MAPTSNSKCITFPRKSQPSETAYAVLGDDSRLWTTLIIKLSSSFYYYLRYTSQPGIDCGQYSIMPFLGVDHGSGCAARVAPQSTAAMQSEQFQGWDCPVLLWYTQAPSSKSTVWEGLAPLWRFSSRTVRHPGILGVSNCHFTYYYCPEDPFPVEVAWAPHL